jgi:hypothetical protein
MKHITIADKSLLLGDEAADLLIEYGAALGRQATADTIELRAMSGDGDDVLVNFLLNPGVTIVAETTTSVAPEPDNDRAEEYMRSRLLEFSRLESATPEDVLGEEIWNREPSD